MARNQHKYIGLSRSLVVNRYKADALRRKKALRLKGVEPKPGFSLKDFLTEKIWKWIEHSTRHLLGRKHEFKFYNGDDKGVYAIDEQFKNEEIRIALAADWASDTEESIQVGARMKSHEPHFTIHMGDTYYTGEPDEIAENFIGDDSPWPRGSLGSFALMGNHEMYSMAKSYYKILLPAIGMRVTPGGKDFKSQGASYFCLHNDHWLIISLDTGYNSVSFPFVWNSFKSNCQLPDALVQWLATEVKPLAATRGIIFLSHHQYVSAFRSQKNYATPAEQLAKVFGKERSTIWIWGHEHRLAFYQKYASLNGIVAYGRCIGHGGMPVELSEMTVDDNRAGANVLVGFDKRERKKIDDVAIGWNGYALLKLISDQLSIEYYDPNKLLLKEEWKSENGVIKGKVTYFQNDPDFAPRQGKVWNDATKP